MANTKPKPKKEFKVVHKDKNGKIIKDLSKVELSKDMLIQINNIIRN